MESSSYAGSQWLLFQQLQHLSPTLHDQYDVSDLPAGPSQGMRRPPEPPVHQRQLLLQLQPEFCCIAEDRTNMGWSSTENNTGMVSNAAEVVVVRAAVQPRHAPSPAFAPECGRQPPHPPQGQSLGGV